jgi:DNA modification methylase
LSAEGRKPLPEKRVCRFGRFKGISNGLQVRNTLRLKLRKNLFKSALKNGNYLIIRNLMTVKSPTKTKQNIQTPVEFFINKIICGDSLKVLKTIPSESIDCIVTSPPYWALRDYGMNGQIGLETSIEEYLDKLIQIFDEVKRVLKPSGTCWINFGDTYANKTKGGHRNKAQNNIFDSLTERSVIPKLKAELSIPAKSLCLIPSRFAIRMIEKSWILRNEIIWHKPNAMPQSIKDRFTVDFEKIFFFVKSRKYFFKQQFEALKNPKELQRRYSNPFEKHIYRKLTGRNYKSIEAIKRSQKEILKTGRNKRCVWTIGTGVSNGNHFAVYPPRLIETPILAGCPVNGIVLDPFIGSGTTAIVAKKFMRQFIGIELNPEYVKIARKRLRMKVS